MTATAATPVPTYRTPGHDSPCWCETCLTCTLDDLLDERAKILQAAFLDRAYTPGLETSLAEEIMHAIPAGKRSAALDYLVTWEHLHPRVMAVDCLLDETDERSYATLDEMARLLLDAIHEQGRAPQALKHLLAAEIDRRRDLLARP